MNENKSSYFGNKNVHTAVLGFFRRLFVHTASDQAQTLSLILNVIVVVLTASILSSRDLEGLSVDELHAGQHFHSLLGNRRVVFYSSACSFLKHTWSISLFSAVKISVIQHVPLIY